MFFFVLLFVLFLVYEFVFHVVFCCVFSLFLPLAVSPRRAGWPGAVHFPCVISILFFDFVFHFVFILLSGRHSACVAFGRPGPTYRH